MSSVRLFREPEDRKPRIGGTRTGVDVFGVLLLRGGRNETGGRCETEVRFSSVGLVLESVLGRINSRWPCGESFVDLSAEDWADWAASTACRRSWVRAGGGSVDAAATFDLRETRVRRVRDFATVNVGCGD